MIGYGKRHIAREVQFLVGKMIPSLIEIRKSGGGVVLGGNVNLKSQQDMQIEISGKLFQDVGLHLRQLGEST